jgi:hypothetical protein
MKGRPIADIPVSSGSTSARRNPTVNPKDVAHAGKRPFGETFVPRTMTRMTEASPHAATYAQ